MNRWKPEKFVFNHPDNDYSRDIYEIVDKYRVLMGLTWHDFIYIGFSHVVREDNDELADAILAYVKNRRRSGRPKGESVKSKLQRMGVNPADVTNQYTK